MRDCKITKKALSVLLALSMVSSWVPIPTHAADVDTCTHHAEHTADCGYVAAVAGSPCTHVCGEACVESCVHSVHDDTCGYIVGTEGTPCAYDCQEDHGTVTDQPGATTEPSVPETTEDAVPETTEGETVPETTETEPVCTCGTDDVSIHATNCPAYMRPENPQCYCVEKCSDTNIWCDICGFDYTQCSGTDTAAVYADCAHTTVTDGICTECQMYGWCGAPEIEGGAVTDKVIWTLTQNNEDADNPTYILTISGEGSMADYEQGTNRSTAPWGIYTDNITAVQVTGNITSIGELSFAFCSNLNSVELTNTISALNFCCFAQCTALTEITLPDNLINIGRGVFLSCSSLETITWSSSSKLKEITRQAFTGCSALTSVILPNGLETIGDGAFSSCDSLTYLEIPASVKTINTDNTVFGSTASTFTIRYLGTTSPTFTGNNCTATTVYVPCTYSVDTFGGKTVTKEHNLAEDTGICSYCHGYCGAEGDGSNAIWSFKDGTLTISGSGATADYIAAKDADNNTLMQTTAPWGVYKDSISKTVVCEGITVLGNMTFRYLSNLTEVSLPDSLTKIGTYVFGNCSSLLEVSLPGSLVEIDTLAFLNCSSLTEIVIPDSVHTMGMAVFGRCSALSDVKLSSSLTMIPQQTFLSCTSLRSLTVPANVKEFGGYVFSSCDSLTTLIYLGDTPPTCSDHIVPYGVTIYVPCTYNGNSSEYFPVTIGHFEAVTGKSNLTYSVSGNSIVQYCNYCQTTDTATLVIEENKAYDGKNKVSVDYTDGWLGGNLDVIEAIQPDNYTASISYGDYTVSETFEITKNQLTITAKDQTITYGESIAFGADQVDAVLGTGDTLTITLTPSTDKATDNGTVTPSDAKITNASGVDVTDNYIITYETGKLIINKSEPVIIFNAEYTPSKTYDGNAVEEPTVEDVTVTGIYEAPVVFTWYKDSVSEGKELSVAPTDAGTYILVASIAETSNTGATSIELNVTISQAAPSVTVAPKVVSGLIYTGDPQELVSGGEAKGGKLVYSTTQDGTYAETITGTDAGSYEVWYKVRGDANHTDNEPVKLSIIEIAQADASDAVVTITGTYSYTSVEIIPAADEVTVTLDGKTLIYDTDYTFTSNNNIEVGTDTAIVTVTFKGNYTGTATGTFTIAECPHNKFEDKKCTQCGGVCGDVVKHDFDKGTNGFCINGCYQPAEDSNSDGYYEIGNAGQLYWFSQQVDSGRTSINAVLTENIVMPQDMSWSPIGDIKNPYKGIFDGQGHTITGLYFNDTSAKEVGFFARLVDEGDSGRGIVRNLGLLNVEFHANTCVGGIAYYVEDGTIENCFVTGNLSGTDTVGGLAADLFFNFVVKNCYFSGTVTVNGSPVEKMLNYTQGFGIEVLENCYYLATSDTHDDGFDGTTAKTSAQFASGEVAYLLQGSQTTAVWGQTIGTESYPVLGGTKVYQVTDCKGGTNGYSNDSTATGVHNYVNGTCTICGDTIELISVDITWGAMEFTYTDGAWNAETHSYGEGSWSDNGTGWVTVENTGNTEVNVTYIYEQVRTDIEGSFTDGTNAITAPVAIPTEQDKTIWLILKNKPTEALSNAHLGTIKLTIE